LRSAEICPEWLFWWLFAFVPFLLTETCLLGPPSVFPYISDVTALSIAEYCQHHPVGFVLTLLVLSVRISVYGAEIKAFIRIPPQRISQWSLKARCAATEKRLGKLFVRVMIFAME
jgi:hypothetical protein